MIQLPDRIRCVREAYGLTQADVADLLDVAPSTYGQIERNAANASYLSLGKVANAIGVSLLFLLDTKNAQFRE
jgi:transcriptional regulator with XRE-family HTH domain